MSVEMETEPRNVEEEYFICNKEGGCGVTSKAVPFGRKESGCYTQDS